MRVDPAVFTPRPRVESALLRMERRGPGATPERARVIRDAFAHRRKSLARSLELARPGALVPARAALAAMEAPGGRPGGGAGATGARAPRGVARGGLGLAAARHPGRPERVRRCCARELNLCLYVGAARADGLHEIRSLFEPLAALRRAEDLAGNRGRRRGRPAGWPGRTWPRRRSSGCARGLEAPPRVEIASGFPSPPGSGAAAPTPPRCCGWRGVRSRGSARSRRPSAPTCPPSSSRALPRGGGRRADRARGPRPARTRSCWCRRTTGSRRPTSTRRRTG